MVRAECCAWIQAFHPDPREDHSKGSLLPIPVPNIFFVSLHINPLHSLQHAAF